MIELLVVVAIIALLVSILLPSLGRAREGARAAACLSNVRQMASGVVMYTSDNGAMLPGAVHMCIYQDTASYIDRLPNGGLDKTQKLQWGAQLAYYIQRYLGDSSRSAKGIDRLATCPSNDAASPMDRATRVSLVKGQGTRVWHYILNTPVKNCNGMAYDRPAQPPYYHTNPSAYFGTTKMNVYKLADLTDASAFPPENRPKSMERIKRAAQEWMLGDGWYWESRRSGGWGSVLPAGTYPYLSNTAEAKLSVALQVGGKVVLVVPAYPFHGTTAKYDGDLNNSSRDTNPASPRFTSGKTNLGYFDGHAEAVRGFKGTANAIFP